LKTSTDIEIIKKKEKKNGSIYYAMDKRSNKQYPIQSYSKDKRRKLEQQRPTNDG
jgi:hypothetical protein